MKAKHAAREESGDQAHDVMALSSCWNKTTFVELMSSCASDFTKQMRAKAGAWHEHGSYRYGRCSGV